MALPGEAPTATRSRVQRALIAVNCLLVASVLVGTGTAAYWVQRARTIPTTEVPSLTPTNDGATGDEDGDEEPRDLGPPKNYLLVGADNAEGLDPSQFGSADEGRSGQRSDTMILVRIDPRRERAVMLSLPRDLYGPIYDAAGNVVEQNRVNAAFELSRDHLVATVQQRFDIPVHHYAQVDLIGFQKLVEAIGGVEVYLEGPVRDRDRLGRNMSGLRIDDVPPGGACVELDGALALAYVRSRHFEQEVDGRWVPDRRGDLDRVQRQQQFIREAVDKALDRALANPIVLNRLIDVARDHVLLDEDLDIATLVDLGEHFEDLSEGTIERRELVLYDDVVGRAQVVRLADDPVNEETFAIFRGEDAEPPPPPEGTPAPAPPPPAPEEVAVQVLNGSGVAGQAAETAGGLASAGFVVAGTGNAPTGATTTTVAHPPGAEAAAALVARHLDAPDPELVADPALVDSVVVTTAPDFDGVLDEPRPPAVVPEPTPGTTAPPPPPPTAPEAPPEPTC